MSTHAFSRKQFVRRPVESVFPFFARPENLALITPPSLGFTILTPSPIVMRAGLVIDYSIRLAGIPIAWQSIITEYNPPYQFVDEQQRGPYAFWRHTHTFTPQGDGTLLEDTVHYALPFGPLGDFVHLCAVRHKLKQIFDFRAAYIERQFTQS